VRLLSAGIVEQKIEIQVDHQGSTVFLRSWQLPSPKGSILLVHDLARSSAIYKDLAPKALEYGYDLYACDLRGHGRSGKNLGHVASFDLLLNDLIQVLAWIKHESANHQPCNVIAEGYACVIVFSLEKRYQQLVHKAVFVKPRFSFRRGIGAFKKALLSFFAELTPRLLVRSRQFMRADEYTRNSKLSIQFLNSFVTALEKYPLRLLRWQVPTLLLRSTSQQDADFIKFKEYLERHKMEFEEQDIATSTQATPLAEGRNLKVIFDWLA
jgi:alpha-beta hydrolase superfamily lysophospholipase